MKRIDFLINNLMRAKRAGAKLVGKSAFEKELNNWINGPEIVITFFTDTCPAIPAPIRFEDEMNFPTLNHLTLLRAWRKIIK